MFAANSVLGFGRKDVGERRQQVFDQKTGAGAGGRTSVQVGGGGSGVPGLHALRQQAADDAGQHVAGAGGGQVGGGGEVDRGLAVGRGDDGVGAFQQDDGVGAG